MFFYISALIISKLLLPIPLSALEIRFGLIILLLQSTGVKMPKNKRKIIKSIIAAAALIGLIYLGYIIYHHQHLSPKTDTLQPPQISAVKPQNRTITLTYNYIGRVEAINSTQIVPYISGYVTKINVTGGENVKKGDVLAVIKQDEYIAALAAATGDLSAAEADFINAKSQYERMQKAGPSAVSQSELDSAKAAYLSAQGALEKATAQKQTAQTNFEYTYLKAPFDGTLGNISLSPGDYISQNSRHLMQLVQYNPIRVVFSISDKQYLKHFHQQTADIILRLRLANGEILPQTGEFKYTANTVDDKTDSLAIYTEFANPENKLLPNAYVEVLLEKTYSDVWLIPKSRVLLQPDGDFIYVVNNNILQTRKVDIIGEYQNQYVAKNDFSANEFWVAEDVDLNLLNQKVTLKNPTSTLALGRNK